MLSRETILIPTDGELQQERLRLLDEIAIRRHRVNDIERMTAMEFPEKVDIRC